MVDLERLAASARRTATRGRWRMAVRVGGLVALLTVVAIVAGGAVAPCACLGGLLFAAAALLRFWGRAGVDAVRVGLAMGTIPLVAAVILQALGMACGPPGAVTTAEVVCVLAGAAAGLGVGAAARDLRGVALATGIASLTAALGCVGVGFGGLLATGALVVMSALVWLPRRPRAA